MGIAIGSVGRVVTSSGSLEMFEKSPTGASDSPERADKGTVTGPGDGGPVEGGFGDGRGTGEKILGVERELPEIWVGGVGVERGVVGGRITGDESNLSSGVGAGDDESDS